MMIIYYIKQIGIHVVCWDLWCLCSSSSRNQEYMTKVRFHVINRYRNLLKELSSRLLSPHFHIYKVQDNNDNWFIGRTLNNFLHQQRTDDTVLNKLLNCTEINTKEDTCIITCKCVDTSRMYPYCSHCTITRLVLYPW